MSKVEHYDKIWSRAASEKYRQNWERTFGHKKTVQRRDYGPEASGEDKRVQRAVTWPATPSPGVSGATEKTSD